MIPGDLVDAWLILVSVCRGRCPDREGDAEINDYLATYRSMLEAGREAR